MAKPPGRPRREPIEDQRRAVLDVARALVAEEGYDGMTLTAVAKRCGYSRASIYDLMGDKLQLFKAVVDDAVDELVAELDSHYAANLTDLDRSLEEVAREEVHFAVDVFRADPARLTIIREADRHYPTATVSGRRRIEQCFADSYTKRAATYGRHRTESAQLVATVVVGAIEAVLVRSAADPVWPIDDAIEWLSQFFLSAILAVETDFESLTTAFDETAARARREAGA